MTNRRGTTILYIAGAGRSGSTLLGQILGQLEGFCFVGEMIGAWQTFGVRRCGCQAMLTDCEFWAAVRQAAGRGTGALEASELFAFGRLRPERYVRLRYEDLVARPRQSIERIVGLVGPALQPPLPGWHQATGRWRATP
jgi:hypothetical protein